MKFVGSSDVMDWGNEDEPMTVEQHLEKMMLQADELEGEMNNAGFRFLGHLVTEERARVSLAFTAMVLAYAKDHGLDVKSPSATDR